MSNPAAPFGGILEDGRNIASPKSDDRSERSNARSEGARFGLAVLAVIGTASLWGWAIMQLCGLFLRVEPALLRSNFLLP